jgi:hypothetical protein
MATRAEEFILGLPEGRSPEEVLDESIFRSIRSDFDRVMAESEEAPREAPRATPVRFQGARTQVAPASLRDATVSPLQFADETVESELPRIPVPESQIRAALPPSVPVEPSFADNVQKALKLGKIGLEQTITGASLLGTDTLEAGLEATEGTVPGRILRGVVDEKQIAVLRESARFTSEVLDQEVAGLMTGVEPLSTTGVGLNVTASIVQSTLPQVTAGLLGASPGLGLAIGAAPAFGKQYLESRFERGRGPVESVLDASYAGLAEALPEWFTFRSILKGKNLVDSAFRGAVSGAVQEPITEALNIGYELGVFRDDVPVGQALLRMLTSGIAGGVGGGLLGFAFHPLQRRHQAAEVENDELGTAEEGAGPFQRRKWAEEYAENLRNIRPEVKDIRTAQWVDREIAALEDMNNERFYPPIKAPRGDVVFFPAGLAPKAPEEPTEDSAILGAVVKGQGGVVKVPGGTPIVAPTVPPQVPQVTTPTAPAVLPEEALGVEEEILPSRSDRQVRLEKDGRDRGFIEQTGDTNEEGATEYSLNLFDDSGVPHTFVSSNPEELMGLGEAILDRGKDLVDELQEDLGSKAEGSELFNYVKAVVEAPKKAPRTKRPSPPATQVRPVEVRQEVPDLAPAPGEVLNVSVPQRELLGRVWLEATSSGDSFIYGLSGKKDLVQVAEAVSRGTVVIEERSENLWALRAKDGTPGHMTLRRSPMTGRYTISAASAPRGYGSLGYQVFGTWAKNNKKQIFPTNAMTMDVLPGEAPPNGYVRRTSNIFASALRFGDTSVMLPDAGQGVDGFLPGKHLNNIGSLARKEAEQVFRAFPSLTALEYDFDSGEILSEEGGVLTERELAAYLGPRGFANEFGVGPTTAKRALMTRQLLRQIKRGQRPKVGAQRAIVYSKGLGKGFDANEFVKGILSLPKRDFVILEEPDGSPMVETSGSPLSRVFKWPWKKPFLAPLPGQARMMKGQEVEGKGLLAVAQGVMKKVLPKTRIIIGVRDFVAKGADGKMVPYEDGIYLILLRRTKLSSMVDTLTHELGHVIKNELWTSAPPEVQEKVLRAFNVWSRKRMVSGSTVRDFIKSRNSLVKSMVDMANPNIPLDADVTEYFAEDWGYWSDFDEWMAEGIGRHLQKRLAYGQVDVLGDVQGFLKEVAGKLRNLYVMAEALGAGKFDPEESIVEFVSNSSGTSPVQPGEGYVPKWAKRLAPGAALEVARYGPYVKRMWTLPQIVDKNRLLPGVAEYGELVQLEADEVLSWTIRANERLKQWRKLSAKQRGALNAFILEVGQLGRHPGLNEEALLSQKHGLQGLSFAVWKGVEADYNSVLDSVEAALVEDAKRTFTNPQVLNDRLNELKVEMARMKSRPYIPFMRYGAYNVTVRERATDEVVFVRGAENFIEQAIWEKRLRGQFPEHLYLVVRGKWDRDMLLYRNMPPSLMHRFADRLGLTQKQREELQEMIMAATPGQAFASRFAKRRNIPGFDENTMRAYASYFTRAGKFIAKLKYGVHEELALDKLRKAIKDSRETLNLEKHQDVLGHLERHLEFVRNPGSDWAALRGALYHWYFGFLPISAAVNLTQPGLVTLPYLAARHGDKKALAALSKAYADVTGVYKGAPKGQDYDRAITMAQQQTFLNESQATELAAMAGEGLLKKFTGRFTRVEDAMWQFQAVSTWMMSNAELLNRRTTFRAAWLLAKEKGLRDPKHIQLLRDNPRQRGALRALGWSDAEAAYFLAAKEAVQKTQYEYAKWARPEWFRGKGGVVLMFKSFLVQHFHFLRNDPGATRALLIQLALAGLIGIPFGDDILKLAKYAARKLLGRDFDVEREAKKLAGEYWERPVDLLFYGLSRESFGLGLLMEMGGVPFPTVDLSQNLSFGRIVPGLNLLDSGEDWEGRFLQGATDVLGPATGLGYAITSAMADSDNPDAFKRWERAMPRIIRFVTKAHEGLTKGAVSTRAGRPIMEVDSDDPRHLAEMAALAMGAVPTRLSRQWNYERKVWEWVNYISARRRAVMRAGVKAQEDDDAEMRETYREMKSELDRDLRSAKVPGAMRLSVTDRDVGLEVRKRQRQSMQGIGVPPVPRKFQPIEKDVREGIGVETLATPKATPRTQAGPDPETF